MLNGLILVLSLFTFLTSCQVKSPELIQGEAVAEINNPGTFSVVVPNSGWKKLGDTIELTLLFPYEVNVTGTPYIKSYFSTPTGSIQTRYLTFDYLSSSAHSLKFSYTVTSWDEDIDGIIFDNFIQTGGGHLSYYLNGVLTDCPLALNYPTYEIKVDGIAPTVTEIFKPTSGNYATGSKINYTLNFSEKVIVNPLASIDLQIGTAASTANYFQGSGTKIVTFQKTILSTESDSDGITNSSILDNPEYITDVAGNVVHPILPSSSSTLNHLATGTINPIIYANVSTPFVSSTSATISSAALGGTIDITLNFNTAVQINTATGVPGIKLIMDSGPTFAYYFSGSGTTQIKFRHTIGANELVASLSAEPQIYLFGGSIKNIAETVNASLNFPAPTFSATSINTMQSSYVTNIIFPSAGTYKAGDVLYFTLVFNRSITVDTTGGTPSIQIALNSGTVNPTYDSGSGSNQIKFKYTVQASDYEPDGILIGPTIALNSGTMVDYLGANVYTTMATGLDSSVKIDAVAPQLSSITTTANGTYSIGNIIQFKAIFNKIVYVTGTPTLTIGLSTSSTTALATYTSGSGTNQLTFKYMVSSGNLDTDGIQISGMNVLSGATIKDAFGTNASTTYTATVISAVKVDAVAPTLNTVSTTSSGTFGLGETISFGVSFNDAVSVIGTPRIIVSVGTQTVYANYSHSTSPTQLVFKYTTGPNLLDNDGISLASELDLNGGQIQDAYGNRIPQSFFLDPLPDTSSILVDSTGPVVNSLSVSGCAASNAIAYNDKSIKFSIQFDEIVLISGNPQIQVLSGDKIYLAKYFSKLDTVGINPYSTVTFEHKVQNDEMDLNGIAAVSPFNFNSGTIMDAKSNLAQLSFGGATFINCKTDGILPKVEAIYPPADNTYGIGDELFFRVVWSENVIIASASPPSLSFTIGSTNKTATHISTVESSNPFVDPVTGSNSGRVSIFKYTVTNGDLDTNGILISNSVSINSGVTDSAGNTALGALPANAVLNPTNVLVDGVKGTFSQLDVVGSINPYFPNYKATSVIRIQLTTSEIAYITGVPKLVVEINTSTVSHLRYANYEYGSGSNTLFFSYEVEPGMDSDEVSINAVSMSAQDSIRDLAGNDFVLTIPDQIAMEPIVIDTIAPAVTGNVTSISSNTSKDYAFFPNDIMKFTVNFTEEVSVSGSPRIELNIGGSTRYANYTSTGSIFDAKRFHYTVDASDAVLDIDGISINPTLQLNGGSIVDKAGNSCSNLTLNYSEKDYVYFSGFEHRYNISTGSYTTSGSNVSTMINLTQNSGKLQAIPGYSTPTVQTSGFGSITPSQGYLDFSASRVLQFSNLSGGTDNLQVVVLVMKTPATLTNSVILNIMTSQYIDNGYDPAYYDNSYESIVAYNNAGNIVSDGYTFNPNMMLNDDSMTTGTTPFVGALVSNTNYVMILKNSSATPFEDGSIIGADETISNYFKGHLAEIIIFKSSPGDAKLEQIRDQLNAMYGIY